MPGLFGACCDCGSPCAYSITREVGGFPEYSLTHATDNPVTYFLGRRYTTASYEVAFSISESHTCGGVFSPSTSITWDGPCLSNFGYTQTSEYSALINIPSASVSGTVCDGSSPGAKASRAMVIIQTGTELCDCHSAISGTVASRTAIARTSGDLSDYPPTKIPALASARLATFLALTAPLYVPHHRGAVCRRHWYCLYLGTGA